jgi:hypothetical protein
MAGRRAARAICPGCLSGGVQLEAKAVPIPTRDNFRGMAERLRRAFEEGPTRRAKGLLRPLVR